VEVAVVEHVGSGETTAIVSLYTNPVMMGVIAGTAPPYAMEPLLAVTVRVAGLTVNVALALLAASCPGTPE
jgi:hypothetical protein